MTTILIDGDIILYQAISSSETEIEWDDDYWVMFTDLTVAHDTFDSLLSSITSASPKKAQYRLCFSDKQNFRKDLNPTYKADRAGKRKPMAFAEFREQILERYPSIIKPGLEADDVLGILATKPGNDCIIWSIDKDLKQIPGKHLVGGEIIEITRREGDFLHMLQTLTGDTVDGYPGCPGMGKVKATKLLTERPEAVEDPWCFVEDAYLKAGLTSEDALLQARMARILRWDDWDETNQKVILWKPYS